MRVGTKSLLIGAHQFALHPLFVAWAWKRLYGWRDLRRWQVWLCFVVHDLGYWGCATMDGEDGTRHPEWGAKIAYRIAGPEWGVFCAGHSRTYATLVGIGTTKLMRADKLATALYPHRLYTTLCWLSGEWVEYRDRWVASISPETGRSTYPGKPDDGVRQWAEHLQANWARFADVNARVGAAYGDE